MKIPIPTPCIDPSPHNREPKYKHVLDFGKRTYASTPGMAERVARAYRSTACT